MHFIDINQLNKFWIQRIISKTYFMMNYREKPLKDKILISYFCEPSTRTCASFQTAMIKLGGSVISLQGDNSSNQKGESLEDSIKTLNSYGDVIILRHPEKGSVERASKVTSVPIINAGDGNGEHPTQALLDIYTIYEELKKDILKENIIVTFIGDLKNSRTIHSLIHLLNLFDVTYIFISPQGLELDTTNLNVLNITLEEALLITDVVYVTRIQKERLDGEKYEPICLSKELLSEANKELIIMHPLPRQEELPPEIDDDPRSVYFKQVAYGVRMRMAILNELL
jgi:carbamoyl-phosphate synthase/aspartate carbamoyltransferase